MENSAETDTGNSGCTADLTSKRPNEVGSGHAPPTDGTDAGKSSAGDGESVVCSELEAAAGDDDNAVDEADQDNEAVEDGDAEEEEEEHQVTLNEGDSKESIDPYGYLTRGDFSSEIYKVELMNLPKRFGIAVSCVFCSQEKRLHRMKCEHDKCSEWMGE